jgi:protein subunit release factor A
MAKLNEYFLQSREGYELLASAARAHHDGSVAQLLKNIQELQEEVADGLAKAEQSVAATSEALESLLAQMDQIEEQEVALSEKAESKSKGGTGALIVSLQLFCGDVPLQTNSVSPLVRSLALVP